MTIPALPPQTPSWGTAARGDAGDTRRTRGLGLGAAVRRYNDLAVPGIGALWFAKPLVWSMIGLALGGKGATRAEIANAVEVVAMFHALATNGGGRNPRINGSTKLGRHGGRFPLFADARRRSFYVTVPFRQGMVQPLRALGLADSDIQRFNAFVPTKQGMEFLSAALAPFRPSNRDAIAVVAEWTKTGRPELVRSAKVGDALTPLTGLPRPAAELLRERLFGGKEALPRKRVRDWLREVKRSGAEVSWAERPDGFDVDHWHDMRDGARFFLMRDASLKVLDAVESLLRTTGCNEASLGAAITAAATQVAALRSAAIAFLSGGREERAPGALAFARAASQGDDGAVLRFLAERDGRGVRPTPTGIASGSAFDPHGPVAAAEDGEFAVPPSDDEDAPPPESVGLRLPPGSSGRLRALNSLDEDIEASCGNGAPAAGNHNE